MADSIKVGDRVRTGVYVIGEWHPMSLGIVVAVSTDGSTAMVDVMSLHGGAPWLRTEMTSHLRLEPEECTCTADNMRFGRCCKAPPALPGKTRQVAEIAMDRIERHKAGNGGGA